MSDEERTTVLVVDDQPNVVRAYALYLEDDYTVVTATGGEEALEKLDATVDIVLLDRRMPDLTGDEVLEQIRAGGYNCRVAMVTAVDPDFDVIDMEFDAYLTKPVKQADIRETVERLSTLISLEATTQEQFALAEKQAVLESSKTDRELEESEEYAEIVDRFQELQDQLDPTMAELSVDEYDALFRDLQH